MQFGHQQPKSVLLKNIMPPFKAMKELTADSDNCLDDKVHLS